MKIIKDKTFDNLFIKISNELIEDSSYTKPRGLKTLEVLFQRVQ